MAAEGKPEDKLMVVYEKPAGWRPSQRGSLGTEHLPASVVAQPLVVSVWSTTEKVGANGRSEGFSAVAVRIGGRENPTDLNELEREYIAALLEHFARQFRTGNPMADSLYQHPTDGPPAPAPAPGINVEDGPPWIVIPYVHNKLRAETRAVGEHLFTEFANVEDSDQAYFKLLTRWWELGRGFILCEEDVVPSVELLNEMWSCPAEWCSAFFYAWGGTMYPDEIKPQYPWRHRITDTLALNKFGTTLLRRAPGAMRDAAARTNHRNHYNMLDLALVHEGAVLQSHPYLAKPHLHGPVEHRTPPAWLPLIGDNEWADG